MSTVARPVETQLKRLEQALSASVQPRPDAAIGRMIAVSGAQALVCFSDDALSDAGDTADFSVGTYLGIRTRTSIVIGVLSEITQEPGADGAPATGRMDMLGEIILGAPDGDRFAPRRVALSEGRQPGHPRRRARAAAHFRRGAAEHHQHRPSAAGPRRSAPMSTSRRWCRSISPSSARPAPANRARVALILREIMAAQMDLRVLLIDPHNEYAGCFEDKAHVLRPGTLRLPYWLFSFDEIVEIVFGTRVRRRATRSGCWRS